MGGITFASKAEASRYISLYLLQKAGKITRLELQPVFKMVVNGVPICKYLADFAYFENGKRVIEDVKGGNATKTPVYRIKIKLLHALYPGIDHREIA